MEKHNYSQSSLKKIQTCHPILRQILFLAIKAAPFDMGVTEGSRPTKRQTELFEKGLSKIDGVTTLSKHNYFPSLAVDIKIYVNGKITWDRAYYNHLAGIIQGIAYMLGVKVRWGGNFDRDEEIMEQSFNDLVHFELDDPRFLIEDEEK